MPHLKRGPLTTFNKTPPCFCRFVARRGNGRKVKPMSAGDIAKRSGLARDTVKKISEMTTWENVRLRTIDAFSRGCGVDLFQPTTHLRFLAESGHQHVQNATPAQRTMLMRLLTKISQPARLLAPTADARP